MGDVEEKERDDDDAAPTTLNNSSPCVAGEFRSALETLFETLEETQTWYVFCVNPNDSQLPNQLEGRSVKGQIRSLGLTEIARRCVNVFEVGMTPREFCDRYREKLAGVGITEGESREQIERARKVLGLKDNDLVLGQYKVSFCEPYCTLRKLTILSPCNRRSSYRMQPFTILKISYAHKIRKRSSVIACEKLNSRAALMCAGRPTPTPHIEIRTANRIPRLLI